MSCLESLVREDVSSEISEASTRWWVYVCGQTKFVGKRLRVAPLQAVTARAEAAFSLCLDSRTMPPEIA